MGNTRAIQIRCLADRKENCFSSGKRIELLQCIFNGCFDGKVTRIDHFWFFLPNLLMPPNDYELSGGNTSHLLTS
jgi:hypothetical protein